MVWTDSMTSVLRDNPSKLLEELPIYEHDGADDYTVV